MAFASGIHSEIIEDGRNGLLAPPIDAAAFAAKLDEVAAVDQTCRNLGAEAEKNFMQLTEQVIFEAAFGKALRIAGGVGV